jgi:hypothetical protein
MSGNEAYREYAGIAKGHVDYPNGSTLVFDREPETEPAFNGGDVDDPPHAPPNTDDGNEDTPNPEATPDDADGSD